MSDRIHAACQNLFRAVTAFSLALQEAKPGDQPARLDVESAWANVLHEVDACRRLAPLVPPSPLGDWLRATLLHIADFRDAYVVPYGIAGCIAGVPIDPDSRTVTALQFPSLTIDPPPSLRDAESPTTTQQAEGGKPTVATDRRGVPLAEANILVRDWLMQHAQDNPAGITRDAVAKGTGVSSGQVSKTAAWRVFQQRRKACTKPQAREIPLTDTMLAVTRSDSKTPNELLSLIEEQQRELAQEERRYKRRHRPS